MNDISSRIICKNKENKPLIPLTISAQDGLINQYDYFDKQIASLNLSTYYILRKGQFAYNKSYSNGYPYGAIKRLEQYDEGALSSLYICFDIKNIDSNFICKYFDSNKWNYEVKLISGEGARNHGLLNLSPSDFFNIKLYVPSNRHEQEKIAIFLGLIQKKIDINKSKIETLKKYKKGLMRYLSKTGIAAHKLKDYVDICDKTRFPSSYGKTNGKYKFYINSINDEVKWVDEYCFDGEYLVLNTGGQAYTNYVNGRFSAMSDCLVLKPLTNAISIYFWLKTNEKMINEEGFQGTGLKHLDQDWLLRQKISLINYDDEKLLNLNMLLESLIELNCSRLEKITLTKHQLLYLMFI